jgi:hypothetical protein
MTAENETNPATVRALTICQPWAWAIMYGPKRYENRGWHTDYLGPLVIHAGKSTKFMADGMRFLRSLKLDVPRDLDFGVVLGVVDMLGCVRASTTGSAGKPDPFAFGPWCHHYANPRRLATPVPCSGRQSFFSVPRDVVAELLDEPGVVAAPANESREDRIERAIDAAGGDRLRLGSQWKPGG